MYREKNRFNLNIRTPVRFVYVYPWSFADRTKNNTDIGPCLKARDSRDAVPIIVI